METDKNQQEKKHYFIVIFGPPASGKTTLASKIENDYVNNQKKFKNNASYALISADCCQEFLRTHSIQQLQQLLEADEGPKQLSKYSLKRSLFNEQLWKASRQFIKKCLPLWLKKWQLLILEDDLLLKSQRKQMRQIVQYTLINYLQLCNLISYEQCLANCQKRSLQLSLDEQISQQKLKDCFNKFQIEQQKYCYALTKQSKINWTVIQNKATPVIIQHPQLKEKQSVSQENAAKDEIEIQIRNLISEIISNQELRDKYFKNKDKKEVAVLLGKLKKNYKGKNRSLQGFLAFLEQETKKMI